MGMTNINFPSHELISTNKYRQMMMEKK